MKTKEEQEIYDFIIKCRNWLLPLGFTEIFKDNHHKISDFNYHFNGMNMRLCCRKRYEREECYGVIEVISNRNMLELGTGNYEIGTLELDKMSKILNDFNKYAVIGLSNEYAKNNNNE